MQDPNLPINRGGFGATGHTEEVAVVVEVTPPVTLERAKGFFLDATQSSAHNDNLCHKDARYFHGEQISPKKQAELEARDQPVVLMPLIPSAINGLLGLVDASETVPECFPRDPSAQNSADIGTKLLRHVSEKEDFLDTRRILAKELFTYGTCAAFIGEGAADGDETVSVKPILWEDFFYDPRSRLHNFADATYLGISKFCNVDEVKQCYPESFAELGDPFDQGTTVFDSKHNNEEQGLWQDRQKRLNVIELYLKQDGEWYKLVFCGAGYLDFGPSPYKDDNGRSICPIVGLSFEVNRENKNARYGPIRNAITLQDDYNNRYTKLLFETNNRQLQIIDDSADLAERDLALEEAAKPNGILPQGFGPLNRNDVFQGNLQLLQQAERAFDRMFPTPAVLGRMQQGQSGRAYQMLSQAGYTEWADVFARLENFELSIYRRIWYAAKQFMSAPTWVRVTNEGRASEFLQVNVPQMGMVQAPVVDPMTGQPVMDPMTGQPAVQLKPGVVAVDQEVAKMDVDIRISTVPDSTTLEKEAYETVFRYVESFQMPVDDPRMKIVLKLFPLPNKTQVIEEWEAARKEVMEEQQAMQQQSMQMQMQQMEQQQQLHGMQVQSKAMKDQAQAHKAEIEAQQAEQELHNQQLQTSFLQSLQVPPPYPHV